MRIRLTPLEVVERLTPLEAVERLKQNNKDGSYLFDDELLNIVENALKYYEDQRICSQRRLLKIGELIGKINENEKKLKTLDEILALYDKWLGHRISDFEFFTLLNEILEKYDILKEVLL